MEFLDLAEKNWPFLRRLTSIHTAVYRATRGLVGHRMPFVPPMLLLDHVGARTGIHRTTPLAYTVDGDDIVIVASKAGYPKHPSWYHNLRADPDTTIQIGRERRRVRAVVADPTQRARLWPEVLRTYSGFADYQSHTDREIPLVILERA
ncbi:nitroreductase family deazaflavin-dependent oxidoreductase [Pseudonocardia spinosispora]|uniref:nitroreductase family deazaflavin-dependent oxidoreductase n=1 Tax=Pseudonocardia spinosispora TaxID=103441 RepID=UPI0004125A39|nr:nitroreductase family deazaflavin-dependent oxidoreductase [Pseudonocardia spinosispora]